MITREYPADWKPGDEPYYPFNDARNEALYRQYERLAAQEGSVVFAGRLDGYKYYEWTRPSPPRSSSCAPSSAWS